MYLKNIYNSNALLKVNENHQTSSSNLGQYSDLAGLAGINLPSSSSEDKGIYAVEIMKSRDFFLVLMDKYDLKLPIMASNGFDNSTGKILINKKIYDDLNEKWVRKVSAPLKPEPSALETHQKFLEKILSVNQNKKTGFVEISINHHSPIFAKKMLEILIFELNEITRNRDLNDAKNAISFLNGQLNKYPLMGSKNVIFKLMEKQLNIQMMAEVQNGYLLKVIDSPNLPVKKSWPSRLMILIFGSILGFSFGLLIVILRSYFFETNSLKGG